MWGVELATLLNIVREFLSKKVFPNDLRSFPFEYRLPNCPNTQDIPHHASQNFDVAQGDKKQRVLKASPMWMWASSLYL